MRWHIRILLSSLGLAGTLAQADGLNVAPSAWPHGQVRLSISTYEPSARLAATSLHGDYYFRGFGVGKSAGVAGGFRATSGLVPSTGTTVLVANLPYVGVGFSGIALDSGLAFSADVGLVADRPSDAPGSGRALFGPQPLDAAVRNLRLTPLLQIGMRYAF